MLDDLHEDVLFPELDADIQHFGELYPECNGRHQSQYYNTATINDLNYRESDFSVFSFNSRSLSAHKTN